MHVVTEGEGNSVEPAQVRRIDIDWVVTKNRLILAKVRDVVARRLAVESKHREVIVFTHDIVFLDQLRTACTQDNRVCEFRLLEKIGKHSGNTKAGRPWDHKSYKERIDSLEKAHKEFKKLPWPAEPHDELTRAMIQQYGFLRITIERIVQDFVINSRVRRFEEYIRIDNLELVVGLTSSDLLEIRQLYNRCRGNIEAHYPASEIDGSPPNAAEFGHDIDTLKRTIERIRKSRQ